MKSSSLLLAAALISSACATAKNPIRDLPAAEIMSVKPEPLPADLEELSGVYVDNGGTALLWLKPVDGEMRAFIQDSLPYGVTDTQTLMDAVDNGKKARTMATDWPFPADKKVDIAPFLSYVLANKVMGTEGAAASMMSGSWQFAHRCHGEPQKNTRRSSIIAYSKTSSGLPIVTVRIWYAAKDDAHQQAMLENSELAEHQRTYLFGKLDEKIKPAFADELADTKNFCRAE